MPEHVAGEQVEPSRCAPDCPGWRIAKFGWIRACPTCDRFDSDADASEHVAGGGWRLDAARMLTEGEIAHAYGATIELKPGQLLRNEEPIQDDPFRELVSAARHLAFPDYPEGRKARIDYHYNNVARLVAALTPFDDVQV
jgi:hypothetical protein